MIVDKGSIIMGRSYMMDDLGTSVCPVKWAIVAFAIVGLAGCQTPKVSDNVNSLAVINLWSSPADPALTFKIKSDGSLSLLKDVRGKELYYEIAAKLIEQRVMRCVQVVYANDPQSPARTLGLPDAHPAEQFFSGPTSGRGELATDRAGPAPHVPGPHGASVASPLGAVQDVPLEAML